MSYSYMLLTCYNKKHAEDLINLFSVAIMDFTEKKTINRNMPQNMSPTSVYTIND